MMLTSSTDFALRLEKLKPSKEFYDFHNLDTTHIEEYDRVYTLKSKKFEKTYEDILLDFIDRYEIQFNNMLNFSFEDKVSYSEGRYLIGWSGTVPVYMNKANNELYAEDCNVPGQVLYQVCLNGERFLRTILVLLENPIIAEKDKQDYNLQALDRCVQIAGGEEYLNFYKYGMFSMD